jgi:hypothetical protein
VEDLGVRGDGGGDVARGHLLHRAADLDHARLGRAGAAVVVVVLALAELPAARATADIAMRRVVATDLLAHDQARAIDQREEGLAMGVGQQHLVGVVGRGRHARGRVHEALDHHAEARPLAEEQPPCADVEGFGLETREHMRRAR